MITNRIAPEFRLLRAFCSVTGAERGPVLYEFFFQTTAGSAVVFLSVSDIDEPAELRKKLHAAGFSLSAAGTSWGNVAEQLTNLVLSERLHPTERWAVAEDGGWWDGVFLLGGSPLPCSAQLIQRPRTARATVHAARRGSAERQAKALRTARHSSALVLAVSAAISAPYLPFRKDLTTAGYGLVFSGPSSMGKTSACRIAASVMASPQSVRALRGSEAGLEETAQGHRHVPFILDEPKDQRSDRRNAAQQLAYLLEGGSPTILHSSQGRSQSRIETIVLLASEDGGLGARSDGEHVRLIEVPCLPMGRFGIIDQHKGAGVSSIKQAARWIDNIQLTLADNHGHVIPAVVTAIVEAGAKKTRRRLGEEVAKFLARAEAELEATDQLGLRARKTFAFFAAAGILACESGALPWNAAKVRNSALRCLAWHESHMRGAGKCHVDPIGVASARLIGALAGRTSTSELTRKNLIKAGAISDESTDVMYVTHDLLLQECGGKGRVKACLQRLEKDGLVLSSNKEGTFMLQKRFNDGLFRVARFRLSALRAATKKL